MLWAKLPGYNPRGHRVGQILTTPAIPDVPTSTTEPDDRSGPARATAPGRPRAVAARA